MSNLLVPREYQLELYRKAIKENVIICADTGTGKTLIAKMVIDYIMNDMKTKNQQKFVMFLVPSVVLCTQQHRYLSDHGDYSVGIFYGSMVEFWNLSQWRSEYQKHQVFVMTAQILLDNLRHAIISFDQIALIVFDECHHAKKSHPYNRIMEEFFSTSVIKPKILGLTASPVSTGVSKSNSNNKQSKLLQDLSVNLNCRIITPSKELLVESLGSQPQEIIEYYPSSSPCYDSYLANVLNDSPVLPNNEKCYFSQKSFESVVEALGSWCASHLAYEILNDIKKLPYHDYLPGFPEHVNYLQHYLTHWSHLLNQPSPLNPHDVSTQAIHLIHLLTTHIKETPRENRICLIIFVQTRYTACYLAKLLQSLTLPQVRSTGSICSNCTSSSLILEKGRQLFSERQLNSDFLVSKNCLSRGYQSRNNSVVMDKFRQGSTQILVATPIGEEGLDVQPCQLVIRFQEIQTVSSYVQSRGRARHMTSRYIVLEKQFDNHPRNFYAVRDCERIMREEIAGSLSAPSTLPNKPDDEDIYIVAATGARVSLNSAITLVYQYCDTLKRDKYTSVTPFYYLVLEDEDEDLFSYELYFPKECSLPSFNGGVHCGKLLAKQRVSLIACKHLHQLGLLDDNLAPVRLINKIDDDLEPFDDSQDTSATSSQPLPQDQHQRQRELHTIDLNFCIPWNEIGSDGKILSMYSISDRHGSLPFVLLTSIPISSASELKVRLNRSSNSNESEIYRLEFIESRQYSSEELLKLQQEFGKLISTKSTSTIRQALTLPSSSLSPLIFASDPRQNISLSHTFNPIITPLLREIEKLFLLLIFLEFNSKIQFTDIFLFQEALTAPATQSSDDYNRLETIGDAILKFMVTIDIFERYSNYNEGQLSVLRDQFISNAVLLDLGLTHHLQHFIQINQSQSNTAYIPPGYLPELREVRHQDGITRIMKSKKILADVIEALIGAVYLDCERSLVKTWNNGFIPLGILQRNNCLYPIITAKKFSTPNQTELTLINAIENILAYQFNNPNLILTAFTHASFLPPAILGEDVDCSTYQRLEFLGDAILGLLITEFLFDWNPQLNSEEISNWKSFIISNEFLGLVTVRSGFSSHIRFNSRLLRQEIDNYLESSRNLQTLHPTTTNQSSSSSSTSTSSDFARFIYPDISAPKVLADVFEAVLGAIFVDSGGNIEECRSIISSHILEPLIIPSLVEDENRIWDIQKHPVSILYEIISTFRCKQIRVSFSPSSLPPAVGVSSTYTATSTATTTTSSTSSSSMVTGSSTKCLLTCHGNLLTEGIGRNKKRAHVAAALNISSKELINQLQSHCTCHATK